MHLRLWLLLAATVILRLPFLAREPYSWDSYNYYLAVENFRPAEDMAHFPGYFNYVMAVRPLAALLPDANAALTAWSLLMSTLLVLLMYFFARGPVARLLGLHDDEAERLGITAAVLTAINPLVWFYGEVGLGYINGAVAGVLAVWSILAPKRNAWQWVLPPLIITWLMGFRLETGALGLLWMRRMAKERAPLSIWMLGFAAGILGLALWILPTVHYAGSWEAYWRQGYGLLSRSSEGYHARSMIVNLARVAMMLFFAVGFGLLPLLWKGCRTLQAWTQLPKEFKRLLGWWILPVVVLLYLFFMLPGYLLVTVPALTVPVAALLVRTPGLRSSLAVAAALSMIYFVLPSSGLLHRNTAPPFTAERIRWSDNRANTFRGILSGRLVPDSSAVLCYDEFYPWRAAMIDFPNVPAYQIGDAKEGRWVVEGYRKREQSVRPWMGELILLPGQVREVAVVRRNEDGRFLEDFPRFGIRDSSVTEYGTIYFAER